MKRTFLNNLGASCLLLGLFLAVSCKNDDLTLDNRQQAAVRPMGDFIKNNYDLSLLNAALEKTGLLDSLNGKGPFTMWAPDNAAFNGLGIARPDDFNSMDMDSLRSSLKYLVLLSRTYISNLPTQLDSKFISWSGQIEYVSVKSNNTPNADGFSVAVDGVMVDGDPKRNIPLQNGVMHLLDVMPKYFPGTLQDFLAKDTALSLFVDFMKKGNLWDSLKMTGPYTIFAPTNQAFLQYGLTADSIARMDASKYNPLAFSIYCLGMQPHHIFSSDVSMIGSNIYDGTAIQIGPYYVTPDGYQPGTVYIARAIGLNFQDGPGSANGTDGDRGKDNLTDNGIVFHIDNILLYPDSLKIK